MPRRRQYEEDFDELDVIELSDPVDEGEVSRTDDLYSDRLPEWVDVPLGIPSAAPPGGSPTKRSATSEALEMIIRNRLRAVGIGPKFCDNDILVGGKVVGFAVGREFAKFPSRGDLVKDDDAFGRFVEEFMP